MKLLQPRGLRVSQSASAFRQALRFPTLHWRVPRDDSSTWQVLPLRNRLSSRSAHWSGAWRKLKGVRPVEGPSSPRPLDPCNLNTPDDDPHSILDPYKSSLPLRAEDAAPPSTFPTDPPTATFWSLLYTEALNSQLSIAASKGDLQAVQAIIHELIYIRAIEPAASHYAALILSNTDPESGSAAYIERHLVNMTRDRLHADSQVLGAAMQALSVHPDFALREEVLERMRKEGVEMTGRLRGLKIAGMVREQQYEMALQEVKRAEIDGTELEAWVLDMLCVFLIKDGEVTAAHELLQRRKSRGDQQIPDGLWDMTLDRAADMYDYEVVKSLWEERVQNSSATSPSDGLCVSALSTAATHGDARLAVQAVAILAGGEPQSMNEHLPAIVEAHLRAGRETETISLLLAVSDLFDKSDPREVTQALRMYLTTHPGRLHPLVQKAHHLIQHTRTHCPLPLLLAALNTCSSLPPPTPTSSVSRREALNSALEIYRTLPSATHPIPIYDALLKPCQIPQSAAEINYILSEIVRWKVKPTATTYDRIILAWQAQAGALDETWTYYAEMQGLGFQPAPGTYLKMVKKFALAGDGRVWRVLGEYEKAMGEEADPWLREWAGEVMGKE